MPSEFDRWIGKTDITRDIVTPGLVDRYAAVIGEGGLKGQVPEGLHWCLCLPDAPMSELGPDGHPETGGFLPPSPLPRRMWASSKVQFLKDIEAGDKIERRSTIDSISEKTGRSGPLLFVNVRHVVHSNEVPAVNELQTIVYREASTVQSKLPEAVKFDLHNWDKTETVSPSNALLFRYSSLTFNTHRIHYDRDYAVDMEGYPELVVHGPLMASLLLRFANEHAAGRKLKAFEFRGLAPAFCHQDLILTARNTEEGIDLAILGVDGKKRMSAKVSF